MAAPRLIDHEAVIALAMDGTAPGDIARQIQRSVGTVKEILCRARADGVPVPVFSPGRHHLSRITVAADARLVRQLDTAAHKRGTNARELAGRLLRAVMEGKLVDAVLDEAD